MSVCEVRFLFDSYGGNTLHESKICSTKMNTRNGYSTLEGFPSFKKKKKNYDKWRRSWIGRSPSWSQTSSICLAPSTAGQSRRFIGVQTTMLKT
jgi:hypothetical protein